MIHRGFRQSFEYRNYTQTLEKCCYIIKSGAVERCMQEYAVGINGQEIFLATLGSGSRLDPCLCPPGHPSAAEKGFLVSLSICIFGHVCHRPCHGGPRVEWGCFRGPEDAPHPKSWVPLESSTIKVALPSRQRKAASGQACLTSFTPRLECLHLNSCQGKIALFPNSDDISKYM